MTLPDAHPASAAVKPLPLVLLHGLLSTPREFGLIALPLQSRGVPLLMPHIEGYTEGDRRRPVRWSSWVDAAARVIRDQVDTDQPFVLGGLCSGGMIAAALAARGEFNLRSVVMLSPTFAYDGWGRTAWWRWRRLGRVLGIDRWISIDESPPYGIKNEKIRGWVERDMRQRANSAAGPSKLPLWAINQSEQLMRHVVAQFPRLPVQTIVMHSRLDEICSLEAARQVFERLPRGTSRLVELENSYHMVTIDNDRQRVTQELLACVQATQRPDAHTIPPSSTDSTLQPRGAAVLPHPLQGATP